MDEAETGTGGGSDGSLQPLRVAVTGASGFVGEALVRSLAARGADVHRLVRREAGPGEIRWDPARGEIDAAALEGFDAVVHLAGESIAGLWTSEKKRRIHESRARGTLLVARTLAKLDRPPRVLVSASGVGYYGDAGEIVLTEASPPGDDFLARVCVDWEAATGPAGEAGVRVVRTRFGVVLDPRGGALHAMRLPFRLGLGARLGGGRQWVSWISRTDAVRVIKLAITNESVGGPINAVAPDVVRNADFTRAVARSVHRPAFLIVPAFALRALPGGMGETVLLASQRATPAVLDRHGFGFAKPRVTDALTASGVD